VPGMLRGHKPQHTGDDQPYEKAHGSGDPPTPTLTAATTDSCLAHLRKVSISEGTFRASGPSRCGSVPATVPLGWCWASVRAPRRHGSPNAGRRGPACRKLDQAVGSDGVDGARSQITAHQWVPSLPKGSTRDGFLALPGTFTDMALRQCRQVASDAEAERIPFGSIDATPVVPRPPFRPVMLRWFGGGRSQR
jgi:hypothetical protein